MTKRGVNGSGSGGGKRKSAKWIRRKMELDAVALLREPTFTYTDAEDLMEKCVVWVMGNAQSWESQPENAMYHDDIMRRAMDVGKEILERDGLLEWFE